MSDKQYDSVLVGYVDDPRYYDGELGNWSFSMTVDELQDVINNYASKVQEDGKGGKAYFKLFMSKNGKPCCSVYNPHSEAAKARRAEKKAKQAEAVGDDLPF